VVSFYFRLQQGHIVSLDLHYQLLRCLEQHVKVARKDDGVLTSLCKQDTYAEDIAMSFGSGFDSTMLI
jgi:hypothetical protein